jgi:hypothetical protein
MRKKELIEIEEHIADLNKRVNYLEYIVDFLSEYGTDGAKVVATCSWGYSYRITYFYNMEIKTYKSGNICPDIKETHKDYIIYSIMGNYYKLDKRINQAVDITEFYKLGENSQNPLDN